ncbi:MAG: uroporphyrinogen decarboxylase [Sphingomonadaceae bacterium]|uniref:uroporphyrinogen decarboxylase n=1 Tax=Thermaurantiacus sp. TaxID=2820283 RepID=UPI00298EEA05|nr:uroporphyrinogen decarboxylase [Thermaurantiacus sp.]MCS6987656.1 uroporphyrinogen decarboxylase [Sphingomonadaceae bacterium]MDW8415257.1 uroporphyrinogen decarboxylase [Thermaurantiacus sp.]
MPPILEVLARRRVDPPPVWLMRQAGRYLPEYRELRERAGGFLDLVCTPDLAAEATLQPVRRFGFDAAILFSDILVVPWALGQELAFGSEEGPRLSPPLAGQSLPLALFAMANRPERLKPIVETVRQVRAALPEDKVLLGFAGGPWTVATYMLAGEGGRVEEARLAALKDPFGFRMLIERITNVTAGFLAAQIVHGAQAVQIFDSWAGQLSVAEFERWVIRPTRQIVETIGHLAPVIGFPRGAGSRLAAYARETGVHAVALDEGAVPDGLPDDLPVQGNVDPLALLAGGEALDREVDAVLARFRDRPHILNLGHGIDKATPIAHVERLVQRLRG